MLFNSLHFLIFFPVVLAVYFFVPHKYRWVLLLVASYYFYMAWKPIYAVLIFTSTVIDYTVAICMGKTDSQEKRKKYLLISVLLNLGILFTFKYFNFFADSLGFFFQQFGTGYELPMLHLLLPIGISFYTFQTISYSIHVYRGDIKPEKHFGIFALYVTFFPQLVAGPIERAMNLLPQFYERHRFEIDRVAQGLRLMLWGFFKKVVIADNIAIIVNNVYNYPTQFTGLSLIVATIAFAIQLYCDFSGYSDIAIGGARVMGFRLMENFNRPYMAKSVADFWKRWHISLTTWFRDYVFLPMGRYRTTPGWLYFATFVVFLVSGLWHGANWTFVIWGAMHGVFLIISMLTRKVRRRFVKTVGLSKVPRLHVVLRVIFTFTLVNLSFIFFRANNLTDAWYIVTHLSVGLVNSIVGLFSPGALPVFIKDLGLGVFVFWQIVAAVVFMEIVHKYENHGKMGERLARQPLWVRWSVYNFVLLWIFFFGFFGEQPFIYFQF
jgi:alginate O-acetyltransferase complex protein AlgI